MEMTFVNNVTASSEHRSSSLEETQANHTNVVAEEGKDTQLLLLSNSTSHVEPPIFLTPSVSTC
jgi:hypothetical protein